jgi:fluoride ion exporter CrcB/FEX
MFTFHRVDNPDKLERQREVLAKIRAFGRKRFVLLSGTIWGVGFVLLMNLVDVFFRHKVVDWGFLPIELDIAAAVGIAGGFSTWSSFERKYRELSARR